MYVIYHRLCPGCGAITVPHTDAIAGSAFLARERGVIRTYNACGTSVGKSQDYIKDLHSMQISTGGISNCISAMAGELDGPVICVPAEAPVTFDDDCDLRICRMPIAPREPSDRYGKEGAASTYSVNEDLLTVRSTLWTSAATQPVMIQIMEVASMDPSAESDETTHKVSKQNV